MTQELAESMLEILARTGLKIWFCLGPEKYVFDHDLYLLDERFSPPQRVLRHGITHSPTGEYLIVSASKMNNVVEASIYPCLNRHLGWTLPARSPLIKNIIGRPNETGFHVRYDKKDYHYFLWYNPPVAVSDSIIPLEQYTAMLKRR